MNRYLISAVLALAASPAISQQAATPKCPDYSLQLAQAVQAFSDRDAAFSQARNLDAQVTQLKAELKSAEDKVTADDAIIKSLHGEPKKDEPAKPEAKP